MIPNKLYSRFNSKKKTFLMKILIEIKIKKLNKISKFFVFLVFWPSLLIQWSKIDQICTIRIVFYKFYITIQFSIKNVSFCY